VLPIPEDHEQKRAEAGQAWRKGELSRWETASYAGQIVGTHGPETRALAAEIRCEVDTVERLAHAQWAFDYLKFYLENHPDRVSAEAQLAKLHRSKCLGYSIFARALPHIRRELHPMDVLAELFIVLDEGGSGAKFEMALRGKVVGGGLPRPTPTRPELHLPPGHYRLPTYGAADMGFIQEAVANGKRLVIVDADVENVEVIF